MGLDLIEGRYFDIETGFLDLLMNDTPRSVAIELSQNALKLFRHLSLESILTHDSNLRLLGIQWNQMCLDAKEIAIADVQQDKMVAVAKSIFDSNWHENGRRRDGAGFCRICRSNTKLPFLQNESTC
ncbi:hypothetical protein N7481_001439 [Penicillium waksmanii]|uniref:uncharacterized protein n=1 Tax=Penicillium waksmanii TaxID=69791 RepID=UPI002546ACD9|nr:uncharacterized protein N7481_001439 [Penicillium waksmanii]KAJ6001030.1 hypothetical protein N7481_001439 [Penicillium waksmanii]